MANFVVPSVTPKLGNKNLVPDTVIAWFTRTFNNVACALGVPAVFTDPIMVPLLGASTRKRFIESFMKTHPQTLDSVQYWAVPVLVNDNHWIIMVYDVSCNHVFIFDSMASDSYEIVIQAIPETSSDGEMMITGGMDGVFVQYSREEETYLPVDPEACARHPFSAEIMDAACNLCRTAMAYCLVHGRPAPPSLDPSQDMPQFTIAYYAYSIRQTGYNCSLFILAMMRDIAKGTARQQLVPLRFSAGKYRLNRTKDIVSMQKLLSKYICLSTRGTFLRQDMHGVSFPEVVIARWIVWGLTQWWWFSDETCSSVRLELVMAKELQGEVFVDNNGQCQKRGEFIEAAVHNALSLVKRGPLALAVNKNAKKKVLITVQTKQFMHRLPIIVPEVGINFMFTGVDLTMGFVEIFHPTGKSCYFRHTNQSDVALKQIRNTFDSTAITMQSHYIEKASETHDSVFLPLTRIEPDGSVRAMGTRSECGDHKYLV